MQDEGCDLCWQDFEDLHCHVEASREMLIARRDLDRSYYSLEDFYCLEKSRYNFDFVLRRQCDVATSASRFPSVLLGDDPLRKDTTGNRLNGSTSYIKNAPGAAFDSFTLRQIEGERDQRMLFCGQQKLYVGTAVSGAMIREEAEKVEKSLPDGTPFVLVVIATKITSDAIGNDLPSNCVVVTGQALEKFYSLFSARANLLSDASLNRINVNTASRSELMTLSGIGKIIADTIVIEREQKGYFANWDALKLRVRRTAKFKEEHFSF